MKILLIYPRYPDTFWSFKHVLKFIAKKAAVPPLGLITVSAMLPARWEKKLVDLNIEKLDDKDLEWADHVFLSGMVIQKESIAEILERCKNHKLKIIAGGPIFTQDHKNYPQIDHFILNEAEITLPEFLADLKAERPKRLYQTDEYADMSLTPVPDYHLLNLKAYAFMNIQVSRGCPFNCDFCEITALLGHKVRMKSSRQILDELQTLYDLNWKGPVSVVDDNFIGNRKVVENHILPAMIEWMKKHKHPFSFNAQTSIDLADDSQMLDLMSRAGFNSTFIGIETPDKESLHSCHKVQNENRNLVESVQKIQKGGLQVSGGFIVGFDSDKPTVFQNQIDFIQKSGIVSAMVGLLNAPKNTRLYKKLEKENRLTVDSTGNNTDSTMNFIPKMNTAELMEGYHHIIKSIYKEKAYYQRIRKLLLHYKPVKSGKSNVDLPRIKAFFRSIFVLGIANKGRREYWKFIFWTLFRKPNLFIEAFTLAVYGYHFRTIYGLREK